MQFTVEKIKEKTSAGNQTVVFSTIAKIGDLEVKSQVYGNIANADKLTIGQVLNIPDTMVKFEKRPISNGGELTWLVI